MRNIVWFRRDLRIGDHPALVAALEGADEIVPVFILDKQQISEAGGKLLAYMSNSLRALDESLGNRLHIIEGDQVEVLKELIALYDVKEVHISTEYERFGAERDARFDNVRDAFWVDPSRMTRVKNQRLVLLDDVMTTGASLFEAARTLRAAGATHITALVLARTETRDHVQDD